MADDATTLLSNNGLGFEPLLDSHQAANLIQLHPKTLQKMAREGRVPAIRIGDLWRFRASALDEWVRSALRVSSQITTHN